MVKIRAMSEHDVESVIGLYRTVYGDSFPFQEFYDAHWVKKGAFDDDIRWFVAETADRGVLGSAAVMLGSGGQADHIGEFGRLVVHPDTRGLGIGTLLMEARLAAAESLIEFGFAECRTAHVGAQKISTRHGFSVIGIEPLAYRVLDHRESTVLVGRLFGNALRLRRNNPHVIPETYRVGSIALGNLGVENDLIIDQLTEPYPVADGHLELGDLEDRQVYRLLRIAGQRGLPEVTGAMRLEHGFLKLASHDARYLVVREGESIVAGMGYVWDDLDAKVSVFELMAVDDRARGTMLAAGLAAIEERHDPAYLQLDIAAHATRMQQTLDYLGFSPVAYSPSMVYHGGERFDVVKMVKLRVPVKLGAWQLVDEAREMATVVERALIDKARGVEVDEVARRVAIFGGLTDVQIARLSALAREVPYLAGEPVFQRDSSDQALFVVLAGAVDIVAEPGGPPIARIAPGEIFGELALIDEMPRSASAICSEASRLLVIRAGDFQAAVQRDPDLGVVILRNIARTLSHRLRGTTKEYERLLSLKATLLTGHSA